MQVYKMDDAAPVRLVEILALQEHDDIVSSVATSRVHDALILSGSYDRRYDLNSGMARRPGQRLSYLDHISPVPQVHMVRGCTHAVLRRSELSETKNTGICELRAARLRLF